MLGAILLTSVIDSLNSAIWGSHFGPFPLIAYFLLGAGLVFTLVTRGVQFRLFGHMAATLFGTARTRVDGVSGFQAFATSLACRVGVGNIVGVATAMVVGGPGAIFWMWVVAGLGMATSMAETTLAQAYKRRDGENFRGGPAYYVRYGLGRPVFAFVLALVSASAMMLAFAPIQSNVMAGAVGSAFGIPSWITGIAVVLLAGLVILGGMRRIARFAELVVPFMALAYVGMAVLVMVLNYSEVPAAFGAIFAGAFGFESALGGLVGGGMAVAIQMGVARGLYSNEAGLGTVPSAAGSANVPHPVTQGMSQSFGVFIDTILICTATALMILLSGAYTAGMSADLAGGLTTTALDAVFGPIGGTLVTVFLLFFAFTTIVALAFLCENNLAFLGLRGRGLIVGRLAFVVMLYIGSVRTLSEVFAAGDAFLGIMALINLVAILALLPTLRRLLNDYEAQRKVGASPTFDADAVPLQGSIDRTAWTSVRPADELELSGANGL